MSQSKKYSVWEAITNAITGLIVSYTIQCLMYGYLNINIPHSQNIAMTWTLIQ